MTAMTRRQAVTALLTFPLAKFDSMRVATAQAKGPTEPAPKRGRAVLTLSLDQWAGIEVAFNGSKQFVSAADIWEALQS